MNTHTPPNLNLETVQGLLNQDPYAELAFARSFARYWASYEIPSVLDGMDFPILKSWKAERQRMRGELVEPMDFIEASTWRFFPRFSVTLAKLDGLKKCKQDTGRDDLDLNTLTPEDNALLAPYVLSELNQLLFASTWDWSAGETQDCHVTGEKVNLSIENGVVKAWLCERSTGERILLTEPIAHQVQELHEVVLPVPSGKILIADWFRDPQGLFRQWSEQHAPERDISSSMGILHQTQTLAQQGIASVFVGNSCPSVLSTPEGLGIGSPHWDEATDDAVGAEKVVGYVCTDLWWVTMVDREKLVSIFQETLGEKEGRDYFEAFLAEHDVMEVNVEPGTYHVTFAADPEIFQEKATGLVGLPGGNALQEPMLCVTRESLLNAAPKITLNSVKPRKP